MQKYIDEKLLAKRWNCTRKRLQAWRVSGKGPLFAKFGTCVRYSLDEIEKFEKANPAVIQPTNK